MEQLPKQPEQHQARQTRALRKCERQRNVNIKRLEGEGIEIRPEVADMERKQGKVEQPEQPQVGHSRVLRKRERR